MNDERQATTLSSVSSAAIFRGFSQSIIITSADPYSTILIITAAVLKDKIMRNIIKKVEYREFVSSVLGNNSMALSYILYIINQ